MLVIDILLSCNLQNLLKLAILGHQDDHVTISTHVQMYLKMGLLNLCYIILGKQKYFKYFVVRTLTYKL